jgi:nucleotide-binding universal stress UspA family protein
MNTATAINKNATPAINKNTAPAINMNTVTGKSVVGFRHILFATDFSLAAAQAIPYVKTLAKYCDADLVVLHVRNPILSPMAAPDAYHIYLQPTKAEDERNRKELLETFAGIPTEVLIKAGGIQFRLESVIEDKHTDLVVIGTRGRTGPKKMLLGSVAEGIFRTVKCPVLTVGLHAGQRSSLRGHIREILYATDFSPESQHAAAFAVSLAEEFQARLVVLHVVADQKVGDLVANHEVMASSEKLVRQVIPWDTQAWCKPEYFVLRGGAANAIVEFAAIREPDLIVLGARREKGVRGPATHLPTAIPHKDPVLTVHH